MATLTRHNKVAPPTYKEYQNFLGNYKSGTLRKEDQISIQSSDSGISVRSFPLSNSSNSTSSSSINSDVTDFSKQTSSCVSYNNYLESTRSKKFNSVKLNFEDSSENQKVETKKSEIYIEIQPTTSVKKVSEIFEQKKCSEVRKSSTTSQKISAKINLFERQSSGDNNKPRIAEKPVIIINKQLISPTESKEFLPPPPEFCTQIQHQTDEENLPPPPPAFCNAPPPPPPMMSPNFTSQPPKQKSSVSTIQATLKNGPHNHTTFTVNNPNGTVPPPPNFSHAISGPPPPPPMMPPNFTSQPPKQKSSVPTIQATLKNGPHNHTTFTVNNPNGTVPETLDKNDPMVRKLVYGTLRGLYGAYHDKANDFVGSLPRNMVQKSDGVQKIIDEIASNGDLEKLTGRVNPKLDQE